ncbi:uncharacterized protein BO96DRAFT_430683 [Aspergillus niger CBS 101883]|uniref:Uncharacterized protein n=2 Tax=Aspergillus niger TaxID=5061 RepID=A2QUN9_ASPNC|nr:uncharacterized protein BO96DRAFT_430683 [Aspergillus niger CBS 101883]XP_059601460.1 hypothetical protein An09g06275 [Aspergillus niger]PYH60775.1 hypothetical protein BO96DRAFT_430683 [Aspergillus niger CBS 101883]CAK40419.1 hypothetical protein An09g06275 [Aspergillus niger]
MTLYTPHPTGLEILSPSQGRTCGYRPSSRPTSVWWLFPPAMSADSLARPSSPAERKSDKHMAKADAINICLNYDEARLTHRNIDIRRRVPNGPGTP